MEFHQLEYFVAIAKYQSFTKAADEINVSQSSLSIQIHKLEQEFGVRLFERTTRSLLLTAAGKEFLPFAEKIMDDAQQAKETMEQFISADRGTIKIGAFPGSRYFGFIDLVSQFKKYYPEIKFDIYEAECAHLLSSLKSFEVDVAFLTHYHEAECMKFYPLAEDHLVVVLQQDHPLASHPIVRLDELTAEPLIFNDETTLYQNALDAFNSLGLKPNIVLRTHGTLSATLGFVSSGLGGTMLSNSVAKFYKNWGFAILDIAPPILRNTYLAVNKSHEKRPIIHNFIDCVLKHAQTHSLTP